MTKKLGVTIKYETESNLEIITGRGPLDEDLYIMLLYLGHPSNVSYEYTLANEATNASQKKEYFWMFDDDWSACNKTCGKGSKRLTPKCFESKYLIVNESLCDSTKKPKDKFKHCNVIECSADWFVGEWQPCDAKCDTASVGYRKRSIFCAIKRPNVHNDSVEILNVPDAKCQDKVRPVTVEECSYKDLAKCKLDGNKTSSRSHWIVGEWSNVGFVRF